jgi:hypothetical protein
MEQLWNYINRKKNRSSGRLMSHGLKLDRTTLRGAGD